jgi:ascorbate-specific PTS system EIIC-type component UlaA
MAIIWILLFPFAIAYARYARSTSGWVAVHATIQTVGLIGVVAFLFLAVTISTDDARTHALIGFALVGSIVVQLVLGISNAMSLKFSSEIRNSSKVRLAHRYLGIAMVFKCSFLIYRS